MSKGLVVEEGLMVEKGLIAGKESATEIRLDMDEGEEAEEGMLGVEAHPEGEL